MPAAQWPADSLTTPAIVGVESHVVVPLREGPPVAKTPAVATLEPEATTTVVLRGSPPEDQAMRDTVLDEPPPRVFSRRELCSTMALVAVENDLPVPFFANLIWQESGFKPHVVSPAGAQGIAQFMPDTASRYGLDNPFDPMHALAVSARFLKDLLGQFGNVGLAAAAYNAGPKRVQDWMAKKSRLPAETRNYVQVITGRPAEQWMQPKAGGAHMPGRAPCVEVAQAIKAQQAKDEALDALATKARAREQSKAAFQLASESSTPVKLAKAATRASMSKASAAKLALVSRASKHAVAKAPSKVAVGKVSPTRMLATNVVVLAPASTKHPTRGPKVVVLKSAAPITHRSPTKVAAAKHPAPARHAGAHKIKVANAR